MSHAAPAAAPAAAKPAAGATVDPVFATAERLYIEFTTRALKMGESGLQLATPAAGVAKLSFDLAQAFHDADAQRRASATPTGATFDASTMCDFDSWGAAAAPASAPAAA